MEEKEKTKEQLIDELMKLHRQIIELEKSEIRHQQMEKASTDNEEKYRILVELAADGILIETVEGRILECSTAGAKIYGYAKEEMIGLTIADLVPEEFSKKLPKVITDKETTNGIFVPRISKKKDGTIFPTEIATKIVSIGGKPRLIAYVRDITKPKEAEKKLRKARKMFTSLFNSSPEALVYEDLDGIILNINPRFTELFGYTLKEIKGRNIDEGMIHPPDKIEEGKKLTRRLEYSTYETIRKKKDGTLFPVLISLSPVIVEEKHQGAIALYQDITERKKAEEALLKSQQEFASLFNSSPEALVYQDEKSNIIDINPRFTELFGYNLNEVKGRNLDNGMIHPPEKMEEGKWMTEKALKGKFYYETIRKKKDGTLFPVSISVSRVMLDGKLQGVIGMYRDITERKQDEQLHQVLYNISKAANSALSLDQLYPLIHQELGSIIDTTNFYIALVDEKEDKIFFPYNIDNTKPIHLPRTINHNSLVAQVIRTGKSIFVNREMIKGKKFMMEFKEWFGMLRKVWLGVPLKVEDRVIGAIVVQSYTNPELYSEKDIKLLEFVSSQVATALERKKAEETLQKSQQEFASLFNSSPQAAIYHDEKGIILNINPRFTELFGYTLEEVKDKNINQGMIFPQDKTREESERLTKLALEGSIVGYETIRKKKDGTLIPVIISTSSVITKEQNKGIIAFYQDITKQNNILEKLKESEEKYRSLFENMPGGYYRADKDGKVIMMNPPGAKLLGCNSPEEIIGKNLAQDLYYIPEDRKRFLEELKKRKGSVKDYGVTLKKRDGTPVIVSTSSHYYYDEEGNIAGVEGIFVDITERKQGEQLHQVLYNISKAANSALSLDQLYGLPPIKRTL